MKALDDPMCQLCAAHGIATKKVNPGDGGSVALGVVPLTSGVVKITGFKVQYRDGTQGTIHTATAGTNISLRATPPSS